MAPAVERRVAAGEHVPLYRRIVWGAPSPLGTFVRAADLGGLELIPTPGHSTDHHIVWDAERRTIFGGDLFLG